VKHTPAVSAAAPRLTPRAEATKPAEAGWGGSLSRLMGMAASGVSAHRRLQSPRSLRADFRPQAPTGGCGLKRHLPALYGQLGA